LSLDVASIATDSTYSQSVDKLDEYKIRVDVKELENEDTSILITSYTVDWGDGTTKSYSSDQRSVQHIYSKSGDYEQTYYVTDSFGTTWAVENDLTVEYEGHIARTALWMKEPEGAAVTASTSLSVFTIGLIALTETGKYKFLALLPLLIPMYTRIQKEDVLDQFVRGQIYGYIKTNPGVHYNQIRRGMGIKNGTLSYHLSVLEKTELIKSRREGLKYRAFYPTGMKFPQNERFRLTELQISILDIIKENEGLNQKEIAKKLDKKPQTINYNIKVLEQADLIEVVKRGRKTVCYHKEPEYSDQPAG
jgi:DNA-binding MarR family transcriptional regulator